MPNDSAMMRKSVIKNLHDGGFSVTAERRQEQFSMIMGG